MGVPAASQLLHCSPLTLTHSRGCVCWTLAGSKRLAVLCVCLPVATQSSDHWSEPTSCFQSDLQLTIGILFCKFLGPCQKQPSHTNKGYISTIVFIGYRVKLRTSSSIHSACFLRYLIFFLHLHFVVMLCIANDELTSPIIWELQSLFSPLGWIV